MNKNETLDSCNFSSPRTLCSRIWLLQVCHGKAGPLRKTSKGDEAFIYCPRNEIGTGQVLQTIEFQCIFKDDHIYQMEQAPNFVPFRKDVIFNKQAQSIILKEIQGLDFLTNPHWGC
ncbi:EVE domain-containing protein [Bartonella taylorii]|uniref:EVE domain-containing protein n=1 Tax=Bartonella taylorii TaxID=33046 RepID=UPI001FEE449D|nr:EVE domain-containing protein [Bartonella taylorii]